MFFWSCYVLGRHQTLYRVWYEGRTFGPEVNLPSPVMLPRLLCGGRKEAPSTRISTNGRSLKEDSMQEQVTTVILFFSSGSKH